MSVSKLCQDNDVFLEFHANCCFVKSQVSNETLLARKVKDGLYIFDTFNLTHLSPNYKPQYNFVLLSSVTPHTNCMTLASNSDVPPTPSKCNLDLWHQRLGHCSIQTTCSVLKTCNILVSNKNMSFCNACCLGKSHKLPFPSSTTTHTHPLELIYTDLWGPATTHSTRGHTYYITFVDSCTRFTWIYFLKRKSEAFAIFVQFKAMVELQFGT